MPKSLTRFCRILLGKRLLCIPVFLLPLVAFLAAPAWQASAFCVLSLPALLCLRFMRLPHDRLHWEGSPPPAEALLHLPVVNVDASLLTRGEREVRCASHPFGPDASLRLSRGSSMLLLATAAALSVDHLPESDGAAMAQRLSPMGFSPEALRKRCPILDDICQDGLTGVICRDGLGKRGYFAAAPTAMLAHCTHVWDGAPRPLDDDDRRRILADASQMEDAGCHAIAYATQDFRGDAPGNLVFLGTIGVGDALPGLAELAPLRHAGVTIRPVNEDQAISLEWLRRQCHAENAPIGTVLVSPLPGADEGARQLIPEPGWPEALADRLIQLRRGERALRRLLLLMAILILMTAAAQPIGGIAVPLVLMALLSADDPAPVRRSSAIAAALFAAGGAAGSSLFLRTVLNVGYAEAAALLLTVVMLLLTLPHGRHTWLKRSWSLLLAGFSACAAVLLLGLPLLAAGFALVAGTLLGLICRAQLYHHPAKKH